MYDVIVIGARVAGSPTAMLLARRGYKVLLVDKAEFPSETLSTHMITVKGSNQLRRWGLLDKVEASNCPPVTNIVLDVDFPAYGHFTLTGFPPPTEDGPGAIYAPKRVVLDKILVDAAAAAGAEVRERFTVTEILQEDGRVVGVRGHGADGREVSEKARIVVGADGMRSLVARSVNAPTYDSTPTHACAYYTYWDNVALKGLEFFTRPGSTVIAFPTNDDQAAIFMEWPRREFAAMKSDLLANYVRTVENISPDLGERLRGGTQAHRFMGTGDLPNFFRKPFGPGWALVGDAGVHKDPVTAQGITDAFRDAELLSDAIDKGLGGTRNLQAALLGYENRRNELLRPLYDFIVEHSKLEPFAQGFQDVLAAMRGNQDAINRFFGVIQNTIEWDDFFSPESLSQIMGLPAPLAAAG
jgi:flavin-dependent dehydrogenase